MDEGEDDPTGHQTGRVTSGNTADSGRHPAQLLERANGETLQTVRLRRVRWTQIYGDDDPHAAVLLSRVNTER